MITIVLTLKILTFFCLFTCSRALLRSWSSLPKIAQRSHHGTIWSHLRDGSNLPIASNLDTSSSSLLHPHDDAVHTLLARFYHPPKYARFSVQFRNPLIPLLQNLPNSGPLFIVGDLINVEDPTLDVAFVLKKASLGII